MSLGVRLLLALAAALLPFFAMEAYNSYALYQSRFEELQRLALQQALSAAADMEQILESTRAVFGAVEVASEIDPTNPSKCGAFLKSVAAASASLSSISVADLEGNVRCSSIEDINAVNISDRQYFKDALTSNDMVLGTYVIGRGDNSPILPMALAQTDSNHTKIGVIVGTIDLKWLSQHLIDRGFVQGGSVTIAGRDGIILARQPLPEQFMGTSVPSEFLHFLQDPKPGNFQALSRDGNQRIYGYVPLAAPPHDLYVSTGLSTDLSFAVLRETLIRQIAAILGLILISALIAAVANRFLISGPVGRILDTIGRWRNGDLKARTHMRSPEGEFGKIGEEFDRAAEAIATQQDAITLLLRELKHRGKNQLALILAFARQIAKHETTVAGFSTALDRRLQSLATSQDLLLHEPAEQVDLQKVISAQLETFELSKSDRVLLKGEPITVGGDVARYVGMAIHELLTNAQKHGALRTDQGTVHIDWGPTGPDNLIFLEWREVHDGAMSTPKAGGFGRVMIEKLIPRLLNGEAKLVMEPPGLFWRISFVNTLPISSSTRR